MWRWLCLLAALDLMAAEQHGLVRFGGEPVPGATVTAQRGDRKLTTITDAEGVFAFPDIQPGIWKMQVEMLGFAPFSRNVDVPDAAVEWELSVLPLPAGLVVRVADPVEVSAKARIASQTNTTAGFQRTDVNANQAAAPSSSPDLDATPQLVQRAADGLLVNGSVNNAATSIFNQSPAFGNNRLPGRWPYNGAFGFTMDNSATDARPYSLTGQNTPRPGYNRFQGLAALTGPIRIPGLLRNGPTFTATYQWTRNRNVTTQSALMPDLAQRAGIFSQPVIDPLSGLPFPGNTIPASRFSPQATSLLRLYPLPNSEGRYNYQIPLVSGQHQDSLQSRVNRRIGRRDNLVGTFAFQSTRSDNPDVFGFLATGRTLNLNASTNWRHTFGPRLALSLGYQFSRIAARTIPFFANRANISGDAGIAGNDQDPANWGPPALVFASNIARLGEDQYSSTRTQSSGVSAEATYIGNNRHNYTFGADFQRTQFNALTQQDARGTFTFTGAATGSDFAGFLLGVPDTSSIAFGNADKYFRSNTWDAYLTDDWRMRSGLTLNIGVRWEYSSPISERYGRLVNLDVGPRFAAASPVVGPRLIQPDRNNFAPRIGFAWRPFPTSTVIVRGGYGVYYDTGVYQNIAMQMAQQAPLSTSLRVQNSAANPLTLADGFRGSPDTTTTIFGIDPGFRIGYAQNWQLSIQRDLPSAMQIVVTYLGTKGTRAIQQFLPNTYPAGALNPCPACPAGFSYMTSNGNSTRHAGQIQLRRRLRNGFTAEIQYTWAKAIDNAALGGAGGLIAQNWLDLHAERGRSNFDQRHVVSVEAQYTTGSSAGGGALMTGRSGAFLHEWTIATTFGYATGLPLTPTYLAAVRGTGVTGNIRANYTGASLYDAPPGLHLNPAAVAPPTPGLWGNAGRNTITGPGQLTMNVSLGRTFRWGDRFYADLRVDANNALNHPVFPSWNTLITSPQFGLPNPAKAMRTVQTTLRVRF